MYGESVNTLQVYSRSKGIASPEWVRTGNKGERWETAEFDIRVVQSDVVS